MILNRPGILKKSQDNIVPLTVTIKDITWATRNVNTPGTFTELTTDSGMMYQWDIAVGWSSTDPLVNSNGSATWNDSVISSNSSWINNPCPSGFRVPTSAEINTLLDSAVTRTYVTNYMNSGRKGWTFTHNGNTLFLPSCGGRDVNGELVNTNMFYYWTATPINANAYELYANTVGVQMLHASKYWAVNIRAVVA